MAPSKGTKRQSVRCDDQLWTEFGDAVDRDDARDEAERDRSSVLRDFMRWYAGHRGAKMPRKPRPPS